mgnify:CR=1 FL=1|tara:strand:- start:2685 stop:2984 length:300 start_codon:yes stop_codon:yes gene_type:complete
MRILGKKTTRRFNHALKTSSAVGTIARKSGHFVEQAGKGVALIGGLTGQPELVAAGAGMVVAGDVAQVGGIALRKTSQGIMKGDKSKVQSGLSKGMSVV